MELRGPRLFDLVGRAVMAALARLLSSGQFRRLRLIVFPWTLLRWPGGPGWLQGRPVNGVADPKGRVHLTGIAAHPTGERVTPDPGSGRQVHRGWHPDHQDSCPAACERARGTLGRQCPPRVLGPDADHRRPPPAGCPRRVRRSLQRLPAAPGPKQNPSAGRAHSPALTGRSASLSQVPSTSFLAHRWARFPPVRLRLHSGRQSKVSQSGSSAAAAVRT